MLFNYHRTYACLWQHILFDLTLNIMFLLNTKLQLLKVNVVDRIFLIGDFLEVASLSCWTVVTSVVYFFNLSFRPFWSMHDTLRLSNSVISDLLLLQLFYFMSKANDINGVLIHQGNFIFEASSFIQATSFIEVIAY